MLNQVVFLMLVPERSNEWRCSRSPTESRTSLSSEQQYKDKKCKNINLEKKSCIEILNFRGNLWKIVIPLLGIGKNVCNLLASIKLPKPSKYLTSSVENEKMTGCFGYTFSFINFQPEIDLPRNIFFQIDKKVMHDKTCFESAWLLKERPR